MEHALTHRQREFDMGEGFTMVIGPSRTGALLEIGVSRRSGTLRLVHAMAARAKFTR